MTIVFTMAMPQTIVMTADSAITHEFSDHREYQQRQKSIFFEGVGCVMTWGAMEGNNIIRWFLEKQSISLGRCSIQDLANLVYEYLVHEFRPSERGLDDVGYHVAGFDRENQARVFHVFWGFDRPLVPSQTERCYKKLDHSPPAGQTTYLYNGRNDLAEVVVHTLLYQVRRGMQTRFHLDSEVGRACFADFVCRFAAEMTPEVGPPFVTRVLWQNNISKVFVNRGFKPLDPICLSNEIIKWNSGKGSESKTAS